MICAPHFDKTSTKRFGTIHRHGMRRSLLALSLLFSVATSDIAGAQEQSAEDKVGELETAKPAIDLSPAAAKNAAHAKALTALVKKYGEADDFSGLQNELLALLKSAYPTLEEKYADGHAPLTAVKGDPARMALAYARVISMALSNTNGVTEAENNKFLNWVLRGKGRPALSFMNAVTKYKSAPAVAEVQLIFLREAYKAMGSKASQTIRSLTDPGANNRKLYPTSRKDIISKVKSILETKPKGCDKDQQDAINLVNVVRFLSGQQPIVGFDKSFADKALMAAQACRKAGHLSHDLGDHTADCNLNYESVGTMTMQRSVICYVEDPGANNREVRGHRAWVLLPGLKKTGFGKIKEYQAMWVKSGMEAPRPEIGYSYPGRGYYPKEYLWGDGWSYYAPEGITLSSDAKVEMWRLPASPKTAPKGKALSDKNKIPVGFTIVHTRNSIPTGQSIVFEPDYSKCLKYKDKIIGVYWVRITSDDFKDEFVVELY